MERQNVMLTKIVIADYVTLIPIKVLYKPPPLYSLHVGSVLAGGASLVVPLIPRYHYCNVVLVI